MVVFQQRKTRAKYQGLTNHKRKSEAENNPSRDVGRHFSLVFQEVAGMIK